MQKLLLLCPAYGRKYASFEDMEKDWQDGKDFKIVGGPYCSIRDKDLMLDQIKRPIALVRSPFDPKPTIVAKPEDRGH